MGDTCWNTYSNLFFIFKENWYIKEVLKKLSKHLCRKNYSKFKKNIYKTFGEESISNPQGNELLDQDLFWNDESEDVDAFLTEIKFKSFSELYEKSMGYIWLKWKREEIAKWSFDDNLKVKEHFIQFKNYVEHRNEHFDAHEEEKKLNYLWITNTVNME